MQIESRAELKKLLQQNASLEGIICINIDLQDFNFQGRHDIRMHFENCALQNAHFNDCSLSHSHFVNCTLDGSNFSNASLESTRFTACSLQQCIMEDLQCLESHFIDCQGHHWHANSAFFRACTLPAQLLAYGSFVGSIFEHCQNFGDGNFSHLFLQGTMFFDCIFNGATFEQCHGQCLDMRHCHLQNTHFVACAWPQAMFTECDLSLAHFEACILQSPSFEKATLPSAKFTSCTLHMPYFKEAQLSGAIFTGHDLQKAHFEKAQLQAASLQNCDLSHANFDHAQMNGADISHSKLYFTSMHNTECIAINKNETSLEYVLGTDAARRKAEKFIP